MATFKFSKKSAGALAAALTAILVLVLNLLGAKPDPMVIDTMGQNVQMALESVEVETVEAVQDTDVSPAPLVINAAGQNVKTKIGN